MRTRIAIPMLIGISLVGLLAGWWTATPGSASRSDETRPVKRQSLLDREQVHSQAAVAAQPAQIAHDSLARRLAKGMTVDYAAEIDRYFHGDFDGKSKWSMLYGLFERWARIQPEAAFEKLDQLRVPEIDVEIGFKANGRWSLGHAPRERMLIAVFSGWGRVDPEGAVVRIDSLGEPDQRETLLQAVINGMIAAPNDAAADHFRLATELAERLDSQSKRSSVWAIAEAWAERDPEAAFDYAATNRKLLEGCTVFVGRRPRLAAELAILQLGDLLSSDYLAASLSHHLYDLHTASPRWNQHGPRLDDACDPFISWALEDPQVALERLDALENDLIGDILQVRTLASLARFRPERATEAFRNVEAKLQPAVARAMASRWSIDDRPAAEDWARSLDSEAARAAALEAIQWKADLGPE